MTGTIHPTAIVSPDAQLGKAVVIGPYTIIHDNVRVGDRVRIDAYCEIGYPTPLAKGEPLVIGNDALIRSHSVFYQGSVFGNGLVTGHHVAVRELTLAGDGFQIGTFADIQGHCSIGHHVRTQSSVTIGHNSVIGNFVWLYPGVLLTNDPNPPSNQVCGVVIEDYAVVAAHATLLPGVRIGRGSFVTAHALVGQDMPPDSLVSGSPAKRMCRASDMRMKNDPRQKAYPWFKRFGRGYPPEVLSYWERGEDPFGGEEAQRVD